jgi:hypothetical protein
MRISPQTLLEIEDMHNLASGSATKTRCVESVATLYVAPSLSLTASNSGRSRNNIKASIEYGMFSPHVVGAGKFTNESQVRIAFAWVLWRGCSLDRGSGTTGTPIDGDEHQ